MQTYTHTHAQTHTHNETGADLDVVVLASPSSRLTDTSYSVAVIHDDTIAILVLQS